jgi:hypothetical protein
MPRYECPDPTVHIDRCYCFQVPFTELKPVAERTGARTVPALQDEAADEGLIFGENCGLCHPYVRRMLRTGDVVFHEIVREADEPAGT